MLTAFTVATGPYVDLWKEQATSTDQHLLPESELALVVFTDHVAAVTAHGTTLDRATVIPVHVPALGWPQATLQRYKLISSFADSVSDGVCLHLDADMLVVRDTGQELMPDEWRGGLALVQHPGFFRSGASWLSPYVQTPRSLASDAWGYVRGEGGIGQWERRRASTAYVPPRLRRKYVIGATWFGRTPEFMTMCHTLAERTERDSTQGIIARWHDESHLNWYSAHHRVTHLDPSYCHSEVYPFVRDLTPRIVAVDKGADWVRPSLEGDVRSSS